jgi:NAD(P)H-dependent FMN reductase
MPSRTVPTIALVVASTRSERFAEFPLAWLIDEIGARDDIHLEVLDLRDDPLPYYDLPKAPALAQRQYSSEREREIGEFLDGADGFIVIANEFNHGYSAALKNTLDHYYAEFRRKAMAFVGYGNVGGARAIEQLRQVVAELEMVSIRHAVHILGPQMAGIRSDPEKRAAEFATLLPRLTLMLDDLVWWSSVLHDARDVS